MQYQIAGEGALSMRMVCISGAWVRGGQLPFWPNVQSEFHGWIPEISEMVVEALEFCHPWDYERLREFRDYLVKKYDDGKPTIFVGHSMGGVLACAVAKRLRRTRVLGIVTLFSPHRMFGGAFLRALDAQGNLGGMPIISFGAVGDLLVPFWATRHPHARRHIRVMALHRRSLEKRRRLVQKIARIVHEEIF